VSPEFVTLVTSRSRGLDETQLVPNACPGLQVVHWSVLRNPTLRPRPQTLVLAKEAPADLPAGGSFMKSRKGVLLSRAGVPALLYQSRRCPEGS